MQLLGLVISHVSLSLRTLSSWDSLGVRPLSQMLGLAKNRCVLVRNDALFERTHHPVVHLVRLVLGLLLGVVTTLLLELLLG